MKPILAVLVGISGSGKSTYATDLQKSLDAKLVQTDEIRVELCGNAEDQSKNGQVFAVARTRVSQFLSEGKNVIIDATSLNRKDRKEWVEIGKAHGVEIYAYFVDVPISVAKARNALRNRKVPDWVIDRQSSKLVTPDISEGFNIVKSVRS